jgi:YVTN family beta-propeller protein
LNRKVPPFLIGLTAVLGGFARLAPGDDTVGQGGIRWRRPVAVQLFDDGRRLAIANRDSGTIVVLDAQERVVASETRVGKRLADLVVLPSHQFLFAVDEEAGDIIALTYESNVVREFARRRVGLSPVSVRVTDDGTQAVVACLWPRRVVLVPLSKTGFDNAAPTPIDVPFAPRRQTLVPGENKVLIADAFGGRMAVIDLASRSLLGVRQFGVQNIRGLTLDPSGRQLYLTHQSLNPTAATQKTEIQNGNLLSNHVRKMALAGLLGHRTSEVLSDQSYSIGDIERGAGDPASVAVDAEGRVLVALAGVDEFAIGQPDRVIWRRVPVGRRPTAIAYDAAQQLAYVANTFSDSISVVDCRAAKVVAEIPLGTPATELRPEERGELLYHDARRSHDAWMSCQSCHPDGHTTGGLNDNFSDGSFGTPKRILSLLGVKDTGPWAWNGGVATLEEQVRSSFKSTMQGPAPSDTEVRDVAAYLRTLRPPPGLAAARAENGAITRQRGEQLFERLGCVTCHRPDVFTSPRTYAVGDDGAKFNPPSMRGVSQGGPYFHDNRALSLEEVVTRFRHQLAEPLPANEVVDLIAYLKSL